MKKLIISTIIILNMAGIIACSGQVITLTFLASDSASGDFLPLDGVFIKNTTLNCDTTIFGEVPTIVLTSSLGTSEFPSTKNKHFAVTQPAPNPFKGITHFKVSLISKRYLWIILSDLNGNIVCKREEQFPSGNHLFEVVSSGNKTFILNISDGEFSESFKLFSNDNTYKPAEIIYTGMEKTFGYKSQAETQEFIYYFGNQLLYKSIKTGYDDAILIDTPTQNAVYTFYLDKLPVVPTLNTIEVTDINYYFAISGGEIVDDGGAPITARGVCWDTIPEPNLEDHYTTDGTGIGIFISELTELSPNTDYYVRAYATNSAGTAYGNQEIFKTPELTEPCGNAFTINHTITGGVAPVDKTTSYQTIDNIPGEPDKCWIASNLGADHKASSVSDISEESAGWYWQFNNKQGFKHDGLTRTPNSTWITSNSGTSDWQSNQDPCSIELGPVWRIPTASEYENIDGAESWADWNGPWASKLKMHASGHLERTDGSLDARGADGNYWTSTNSSSSQAFYFGFDYNTSEIWPHYKSFAFALRCVRD